MSCFVANLRIVDFLIIVTSVSYIYGHL